ncbi:MAG TPA: transcriptional regulator, partial [Clostridiaceae bacterium]|nr:transcriptional regulator [Clostridiaceae bacterium]
YDRENRGSTYCGDYLALPHRCSDCVTKPSIAIAKMKYRVPWDENGNLVKLVIMLTIPKASKMEEESEALKMVASSLGDRKFIKQLLDADTKEALIELINNCLNDNMRS